MPAFLEKKLEREYGKGNSRVYATMNKLGLMHGSKETAKGRAASAKHKASVSEMMGHHKVASEDDE